MRPSAILSRPVLCEVEKLTKPIRVGPVLLVSERLHGNLVRISQLIGNAPMLNALRMSALEGSDIVLEKLSGRTNTIVDDSIQAKVNAVLYEFEDSIEACAKTNHCDEVEGLKILLQIGARAGKFNDYSAPVEDEKEGKKRA